MRHLGILVLVLGSYTCLSSAQENIRQVDFNNFTYPLSGHLLGHDRLEWLNIPERAQAKKQPIQLVKGSNLTKTSSFVMDGKEYDQYEGFTLESVKFADLTGNGEEEAIVVLRYHTGGTQTTNYVYVYTLDNHEPKLLAYCHTGDRAYSGLYKVYGNDGLLTFELLDPKRASGDCCSSGIIVSRYRWHNTRFEAIGPIERRSLSTDPSNR
jgi:hypothetical protein